MLTEKYLKAKFISDYQAQRTFFTALHQLTEKRKLEKVLYQAQKTQVSLNLLKSTFKKWKTALVKNYEKDIRNKKQNTQLLRKYFKILQAYKRERILEHLYQQNMSNLILKGEMKLLKNILLRWKWIVNSRKRDRDVLTSIHKRQELNIKRNRFMAWQKALLQSVIKKLENEKNKNLILTVIHKELF